MKKTFIVGIALALTALLMFSCNKNRFDFDQLESVEGSGQWNLPIGSVQVSLKQVLDQLNYNGMINFDADSNLYLTFDYSFDNILSGRNFMSLKAYKFEADLKLQNGLYGSGLVIPETGWDTTLHFHQRIEISTDSVSSIELIRIASGGIHVGLESNSFRVDNCLVTSADITSSQWPGGTMHGESEGGQLQLDLAGATFNLTNDSIVLDYAIECTLFSSAINHPEFVLNATVELKDTEIGEIKGHLVQEYTKLDPVDTTFFLPMNVSGDIALKNAKLVIKHKNTFGGLNAAARIDTLEFYGEDGVTSPIFPDGFAPSLFPTGDEFVETVYYPNLHINTQHNSFRMSGEAVFNPGGVSNAISIYNNSVIGLGLAVEVPFSFVSEEGVYYLDTFDVDMSQIDVTEFINEVVLHIEFNSKFPFNLNAQLYTFEDYMPLLDNDLSIGAWTPGNPPVITSTSVSVTHESLNRLLASKRLILMANLNTGGTTASVNANNSLGLTLKADVKYGGSLDINN